MKKTWTLPNIEVLDVKQSEYWTTGTGHDGWSLTLSDGTTSTVAHFSSSPGADAVDVTKLPWLQDLLNHS